MTIDTLAQRVLISTKLIILLSVQEYLIDVIVIKVVDVANMRSLDNGDWLLLLLLRAQLGVLRSLI